MILPYRNVRDVLGLHAKVSSRKTALISYDAELNRLDLSYLELVGKVHQIANFLYEDLGINRGDTIAIVSKNKENALLLYFATWLIGGAVVSIDVLQSVESAKFALEDSGARILFADHVLLPSYSAIANSIPAIEGIMQIGGEQDENYLRLEDLASNRPTSFLGDESGAKGADIPMTGGNERTARLSDMALITYVNGQAIRRTQGDLLYNANRLAQATALTGNQKVLAVLPFHSKFDLSIMVPLLVSATLILIEDFSADLFWHVIVKENIHTAVLDAPSIQQLVDTSDQHMDAGEMRFGGKIIQQDVKHFRHIVTTDPMLTTQLACDFEDIFGIPLITGYQHPKTEELLSLLPITLAWTHHQRWLHGKHRPSIGVALDDLIVMDENGNALAENQVGQIAIKQGGSWQATGDTGFYLIDEVGTRFHFLHLKS